MQVGKKTIAHPQHKKTFDGHELYEPLYADETPRAPKQRGASLQDETKWLNEQKQQSQV